MSDAGVKRCIDLMTAGLWVTGRSGSEVAKEFSVSPETVKEWAVSASRIIRLALDADGAKEEIRARMVATLDTCVSRAMSAKKPIYLREGGGKDAVTVTEIWEAPEVGAAVAAISEQARLLGLSVQTHKVDMTVRELEALPPPALLARLREQRARLDEAIAKLEAEHPELTLPSAPGDVFNVNREANPPRLAELKPERPRAGLCNERIVDGAWSGFCTKPAGHEDGHAWDQRVAWTHPGETP